MNKLSKKIAITTGDVNGIGAEVTIKALNKLCLPKESIVIISNSKILKHYGRLISDYKIIEIPYAEKDILPGKLTRESGEFSFQALKKACELVKEKKISAIVTAPTAKEAMYLAEHKYNGQTEVLQDFLGSSESKAEMLFIANDFRVLLLTRHVSIKEISLDKNEIISKIKFINNFLKSKVGVKEPRLAITGLNPHAGENGILGREEIEILQPAIIELRENNINITNPLPADTLFIDAAKAYLNNSKMPYDCYIATYHDQGLIPIKTVASAKTVNMTIGLDVIRTSPCHGTAFDIAGKNIADESSMIEAIRAVL